MSETFLFVHGAWHGGWCWKDTEKALRELGHETHAPTLSGLGELSHLAHPDITPDSHVEDILAVIKWRELDNIVLVGHSYGGLIVTGVASKVPEKIKSLVYLDAFAPEVSGKSIFADANPERMAAFEAEAANGNFLVEPDLFDAWTDDPVKKEWLKSMCTPHPIGSFRFGVTLSGRQSEVESRHYIVCSRNSPSPFQNEFQRVKAQPGWQTQEIAAKHDAMVEAPQVLATMLHKIAKEERAA